MDIKVVYLIILVVLLTLSAFFSSSEAAFLTVRRLRLRHLEATGVKGAGQVLRMAEHPEKLLPTILLSNNLVNVLFASIATLLAVDVLGPSRGVAVATGAGTFIIFVLGESLPKTIAISHSERFAFLFATPLIWVERIFWPVVKLMELLNMLTIRIVGGGSPRRLITAEEIRVLISVGQKVGAVETEEAEMLQNVFRFGDMQVRELMTPRTEIVWVENGTTLGAFLEIYSVNSHNRFPVCQDSLDNVVGVLSINDVFKAFGQEEIDKGADVTKLARETYFVPETKLIASLFEDMRTTGYQMAMVVDEYGGISGLVTIKQLIEKVVGRVGEEGEKTEEEYETIDKDTLHIDAGMSVGDANTELSLGLPEGDYDTIAGFVLETLGRIPKVGDHLHYKNLKFEIAEMNGHKIEKVAVKKGFVQDGRRTS